MEADLSILICSINERAKQLAALLAHLRRQQQAADGGVEILTEVDDCQMAIGTKRQLLLEQATGKYVAFIDDDDGVSEDYVKLILDVLIYNPDVVGITGIYYECGRRVKPFIHTIDCKSWHETPQAYWRMPNHLNPVKREHALAVGFLNKNHGEDFVYSTKLQQSGLLEREVRIDKPIYHYYFDHRKTRSRKA